MSLRDVRYTAEGIEWPRHRRTAGEDCLAGYLDEARAILASAGMERDAGSGRCTGDLTRDFEHLRWFPLPGEVGDRAET